VSTVAPRAGEESQRISSASTDFWKWLWTPLWIILFGVFILLGWLGVLDAQIPVAGLLALSGVWLGLGSFFVFWSMKLDHVWLVGDELRVVRRGRTLRFPLREIRDISETRWSRVKIVTLKLRPGSPAGRSIFFIPPWRPLAFLSHPLVTELRDRRELLESHSVGSPKFPRDEDR
jgi:hypothetical protein